MKYLDAKPHLRVGMKIKIIKSTCCSGQEGGVGTISRINLNDINLTELGHSPGFCYPKDEEIEILTNPDGSKWRIHNTTGWGECIGCAQDSVKQFSLGKLEFSKGFKTTNEPKAQKGFIMNVVDKIKNFKLTKEDRILRENGLEDEDGKMTSQAVDMMDKEMIDERWATRRLEVAQDLLDIKNEDKE